MRNEQIFPLENVISGGKEYRAYQMPFQNLYETLEETSKRFPRKVGVIDAQGQITYSALQQRTDALAA